jgi:polar amino acid transport system substrate-binding protein
MHRLAAASLLVAAGVLGSVSAEAAPSFTSGGKLVVCTDATFPPMEYFKQAGDKTPVGFDVDFVNALAAHWQATPEIVVLDFSGLLPALESKRCDAVISGIFLTDERQKNFDGVPYVSTASVLVGKGDTAPIASTDELSGKVVAVQTGTSFVELMEGVNAGLTQAGKAPAEVQLYPKASDVIQQVVLGRAFAGFTQDTEVAFRSLQQPGQLATLYTFPEREKFAIYVRRTGNDKAEVEAAIEALRADGTLGKLAEAWALAPEQLNVSP